MTTPEDCAPEEIAGPDIYPSVPVDVVRRVLRFARLAEAASLLRQAETIMHSCGRGRATGASFLNLVQETANEIEQPAAGRLAPVTYQPEADETDDPS